jgi:DNA-binding HxlR family transcriptional regulator
MRDIENNTVDEVCPVEWTASLAGDRWTLLIIRDLESGRKRFNELQKSLLRISPRTLSERLGKLEKRGFVTRRAYAEIPPREEYMLTEMGNGLISIIEAMRKYGEAWSKRDVNR